MNLVTLPLATPAQLPPYVASRTLMAFAGFFSSAVTLATGEQRIMKATEPSARPRCIQSSENLEAPCSLSLACGRADRTGRVTAAEHDRAGLFAYVIFMPTLVASYQGFT